MTFVEILGLLLTMGPQAWDFFQRIKDDIQEDGSVDAAIIEYEKSKLNEPLEKQ